jgi:hypothetical protein
MHSAISCVMLLAGMVGCNFLGCVVYAKQNWEMFVIFFFRSKVRR